MVAYETLTVDPNTLVNADPTSWIRVSVRTNAGGAIIDPTAGTILLGPWSDQIRGSETATPSLPVTDGDTNPTDFQYTVDLNYTDAADRKRKTWNSGWFSFTAAANLAEIAAEQYAPPTWQSTFISSVEDIRDQAEGYADAAAASAALAHDISNIDTSDGVVKALIEDGDSETASALSASIADTAKADGGATGAAPAVWDTIAAWAGADAFIDFTTKADGDPPDHLDSGQHVDYLLQNVSNRKPQIAGGQLIHGTLPGSGAFANYYQAECDAPVRAAGTRWVVNSADGSTDGTMCVAVWTDVYEAAGTTVPRTPCHLTISTITGEWKWWVSDGDGSGSDHLKVVKQGTFTPPASDGVAVWEAAFYIDPDAGVGYGYLPGNDATTGTRFITVTNAEIATALTAVSLPTKTLAELLTGAVVVMIEHFATTAANTARYPRFLSMWGETLRPARDRSRALRARATAAASRALPQRYAPTTQLTVASPTSLTAVDSTNVKTNACVVGPSGVVAGLAVFEVECTTADTYYVRMTGAGGGATNTVLEGMKLDVGNHLITLPWQVTGLSPGSSPRWVLSHQSLVAATVTVKAGGTGSTLRRAVFLTADPIDA